MVWMSADQTNCFTPSTNHVLSLLFFLERKQAGAWNKESKK
jgi:hypothetical protein